MHLRMTAGMLYVSGHWIALKFRHAIRLLWKHGMFFNRVILFAKKLCQVEWRHNSSRDAIARLLIVCQWLLQLLKHGLPRTQFQHVSSAPFHWYFLWLTSKPLCFSFCMRREQSCREMSTDPVNVTTVRITRRKVKPRPATVDKSPSHQHKN